MKKITAVMLLTMLSPLAYADIGRFLPEAKLPEGSATPLNVGLGVTSKLVHLNGEWVNPYSITYAKLGAYFNDGHAVGGQVGIRFPYYFTGTDKNGYYFGLYAGTIQSKEIAGDDKLRFGGGVDLAYVWLNPDRISTLSLGIGAGEKLKNPDGSTSEAVEPQLQLAYSLSFAL